jgi:hypothetical protein
MKTESSSEREFATIIVLLSALAFGGIAAIAQALHISQSGNHEALYQYGHFGSGAVSAWSVATDHGYTLDNVWDTPRLATYKTHRRHRRSFARPDLQRSRVANC